MRCLMKGIMSMGPGRIIYLREDTVGGLCFQPKLEPSIFPE